MIKRKRVRILVVLLAIMLATSVYLYIDSLSVPGPTGFSDQEIGRVIRAKDSSEPLDNGSTVNKLVILSTQVSYICDVSELIFSVGQDGDANWTILQASGNYTSGQIVLSNASSDLIWNDTDIVILSEPTPDWMTKPGILHIRVAHEPGGERIYEGAIYVS